MYITSIHQRMPHRSKAKPDDVIIIISDSEGDEVLTIDLTGVDDDIGGCDNAVLHSQLPVRSPHKAMHHETCQNVESTYQGSPTIGLCSPPLTPHQAPSDTHTSRKCILAQNNASPKTLLSRLAPNHSVPDSTKSKDVSSRSPLEVKEKSRNSKNKQEKNRTTPEKTIGWTSSDSDFEDEVSTPRKSLHHHKRPPDRKAMLVASFPSAHYNDEKKSTVTSYDVHRLSGSESELPNPCSFLFSQQRSSVASSSLVERYPSIPACKQEPDPSYCLTPQRRDMGHADILWGESMEAAPDQTSPAMACSTPPKNHARRNFKRPLLTLSDYSSSEEEFEAFDMPILHTSFKKNRQSRTLPHREEDQALEGTCCRQKQFIGVPVHIGIHNAAKDAKCDMPSGNAGTSGVRSKSEDSPSDAIWDFCQRQRHLIAAVVEEDFIDDAIIFIRDFATLHRGAPAEYMMYLLEKVLLADDMEEHTILSAYDALMYIHSLHPSTMATLKLDWDLITSIIKKLDLETPLDVTQTPCLAHVLALQFVLVVVMHDYQAAKRKKMVKRSYVHNLLSADMRLGHIRNVIQWICQVITNKLRKKQEPDESEDRNIWQFVQQLTKQPQAEDKELWSMPTAPSYYTVLELLQRLILLSVSMDLNSSAVKIAEEFLCPYQHIPSLEQRRTCLQTLTCDLVKSKLIEVLLENHCELRPDKKLEVLTIRKIVEGYFQSDLVRCTSLEQTQRQPRDAEKELGTGMLSNRMLEIQQKEDTCEELAMLLFFLLQSYIRNKSAKWKRSGSSGVQSSLLSVPSLLSEPSQSPIPSWLSIDDRECLCQMGDYVEALERRLKVHCTSLTARTRLYLAQMESMRELAY